VFEYQAMVPAAGQTYTYSTTTQPADQTYTYSTMMQPQDQTYTYSTMQQPQQGEYTYTAMPGSDGQTFYNAEETVPQMTVINGYANEDNNNMEKWFTLPVGTLHPLDIAGDWQMGAFDSINPDGTTRASAPLTLSGERSDGTVAADARANRRAGLAPAQFKAARFTELLQKSSQPVWKTPIAKVAKLSPADQRRWAKHVMAAHELHEVWATKSKDVSRLSPAEQREWAAHVVAEAKQHAAAMRGDAKWAAKVQRLLAAQQHGARGAGVRGAAAQQQRVQGPRFDRFGFPELRGQFAGAAAEGLAAQSPAAMARALRDGAPCGPGCQQRAVAAAFNALPIH